MGEAARRKRAGSYPTPDDPIEKLRRFWCGRSDAGPVEDFRTPEGTVAITADVQGAAPSTWVFDAGNLADIMAEAGKAAPSIGYHSMVIGLAKQFSAAKQRGDETEFLGLGIGIMWTALYHPKAGAKMRQAVSDALWRDGKAHITWQFSPAIGLAMTLAKQFVDLEPIAARLPRDRVVMFDGESGKVIDCGGRRHG